MSIISIIYVPHLHAINHFSKSSLMLKCSKKDKGLFSRTLLKKKNIIFLVKIRSCEVAILEKVETLLHALFCFFIAMATMPTILGLIAAMTVGLQSSFPLLEAPHT